VPIQLINVFNTAKVRWEIMNAFRNKDIQDIVRQILWRWRSIPSALSNRRK